MLGQRLPAESFTATTSLKLSAATAGSRAGLVVLGETYAWVGLRHDGDRIVLVCRTAAQDAAEVDAITPVPLPLPLPRGRSGVRLRVGVRPGAVCQFAADVAGRGFTPLGAPFPATTGKWIGATLGLFATGPATGGTGDVTTGGTGDVAADRTGGVAADRTGGVATGGTDGVAARGTDGSAEFDWFRVGPFSS
ncbi:hypothetical protein [Streptomyces iranensis]|uniref:beta-xylosidase family glycoside hydrolase n=1 Tax=Streptomyces iranensis TaxID=576784 RepID=UPI0039B74EE7